MVWHAWYTCNLQAWSSLWPLQPWSILGIERLSPFRRSPNLVATFECVLKVNMQNHIQRLNDEGPTTGRDFRLHRYILPKSLQLVRSLSYDARKLYVVVSRICVCLVYNSASRCCQIRELCYVWDPSLLCPSPLLLSRTTPENHIVFRRTVQRCPKAPKRFCFEFWK